MFIRIEEAAVCLCDAHTSSQLHVATCHFDCEGDTSL